VLASAQYPIYSVRKVATSFLEVLSARSRNSLEVLKDVWGRAMTDELGPHRLNESRDLPVSSEIVNRDRPELYEFGPFRLEPAERKLTRGNEIVTLAPKAFDTLVMLVRNSGHLLEKDDLISTLWPDTFVEEGSLSNNIFLLRKALGEDPAFIETVPRRGYRFIGEIALPARGPEQHGAKRVSTLPGTSEVLPSADTRTRRLALRYSIMSFVVALLAGAVLFLIYGKLYRVAPQKQRALTRVTFDKGLQFGATWSPDNRMIAYSSDRGGKFDIWVQQITGGDPVQITKSPGHNWQPDWSPDGKYIVYRSEDGEGGLFIIPALGGVGSERKIAPHGYYPRWSPDGSQILFQTNQVPRVNHFGVVSLDGSEPHEVLTEFVAKHGISPKSAAWHPDGKRISVWLWDAYINDATNGPVPTFWTVPVAGGEGTKSEIDPQILRQLGGVSVGRNDEVGKDFKFSWTPSGRAILFERTFRGVRNLWKMTVDPETLRALAIERLTTGSGLDTEFALSADGRKIAFTVESDQVQAWLFPFDATRGRLTGIGRAVTSPGMEAAQPSLSRDGKKLAFAALRAGKWELWEKSLVDGREARIAADDYFRDGPQWSPDGTRLVYGRVKSIGPGGNQSQLVVWSAESRGEEPLTAASDPAMSVSDWSSDGKQLLVVQQTSDADRTQISAVLVPVYNSAPTFRKIVSMPGYYLFQPNVSPDGRWIVFNAMKDQSTRSESTLYVMPATGGPWIRITDGKHWADKPRWAPDGKTLYFVSCRDGFFNVWGMHFDSARGIVVGDPFRITAFDSSGLMVPKHMSPVNMSLTQDTLMLTMEQVSGSIWVLNDVD
jgi:Tol biopolymer transport system component/DNA-binding winged helix-turn-helix (wHTH) protein